jgi:ribonuclease E
VGHISHFGLLEMSRQRLRPGLLEGSSRTCPHCEGRGVVRSVSSCGLSVLRAVEEQLMARKPENLTVKCPREIAFYILNEKRDNLLAIETAYGVSVFIVPSEELKGSQALIERAPDRSLPQRKAAAAPVRIDSAYAGDEDAEEPAAEDLDAVEGEAGEPGETAEAGDDGQAQGNGERGDGGRRRRRRRGRRGGRNRDDQPGEATSAPGGDLLPGLGDQPDIGMPAAFGAGETTGGEMALAIPATEGGEPVITMSSEEPRAAEDDRGERRGRRDRWGRNRDRRPREAAATEAIESAAPEMPAPVATVAPAEAEPEPSAEPPRRWQPPAPTVPAAPAERKAGWWSKRG